MRNRLLAWITSGTFRPTGTASLSATLDRHATLDDEHFSFVVLAQPDREPVPAAWIVAPPALTENGQSG